MSSRPQRDHDPAPIAIADTEPAWVSLFNSARYHALNLGDGEQLVRLACTHDGRELGSLSGVVTGGRFVNGYRAPFGGMDLARPRETPENVDAVVRDVLTQLAELGVREAEVRLRPSCYSPSEQLTLFTLLNHGFTVTQAEFNQQLVLDGIATADEYVAMLRSPARRALKHLADASLTLHEVHDDAEWERCYALLQANRIAKGRQLSMTSDYLARARRALTPYVRMFELRTPDGPCAAALTYRVLPGRELIVAWGDSGHALQRSPMNMLALRTVERALAERVTVLDLGISNEHGSVLPLTVNAGLVQFKQSIGAVTEARLTLTRSID